MYELFLGYLLQKGINSERVQNFCWFMLFLM